MLTIKIPGREIYDEVNNLFITIKPCELSMEHSLVSISKWESKWNIPFLDKEEKTQEQYIDYFKCMTLTKNVDPNVYMNLTPKNIKEINDYISAPMTATTFTKSQNKPSRDIITSEVIYYWMIALQIPMECQRWHLNRLLTLIEVCERKNNPKKMSKRAIAEQNAAINATRKAKTGSRG